MLLAFLRAGLVHERGWLTEAQLLDAVAVGQVTPGPVFTTATFVGYVLAASFFLAAMLKPFRPERAGLFRTAAGDELTLRLGLSGSPTPPGEELLGWWIVPLGVLLGGTAYGLTVSFARWAIRRYRRRPLEPSS